MDQNTIKIIIASIIVFLVIVLVLVVLLLVAKAKLLPGGKVKILINGKKERKIEESETKGLIFYFSSCKYLQ